jgi:hypothetical protein
VSFVQRLAILMGLVVRGEVIVNVNLVGACWSSDWRFCCVLVVKKQIIYMGGRVFTPIDPDE